MSDYLSTEFDLSDPEFVSTIDELTLWAAPFGLMMLEHLRLRKGIKVLDIGCGIGFPTLEIAQRLGDSSTVYGLDTWSTALERGRQKIKNHLVKNVKFMEGNACETGFKNKTFDLVVSNLGINNFEKPEEVIRESYRILKIKGQIVLTTNFKGHMQKFYEIFRHTLTELNMNEYYPALQKNIDHRLDSEIVSKMLENAGFHISKSVTDSFRMRYTDGSSFLRHYFIRLGFLEGWKKIIPEDQQISFFGKLEENLNKKADRDGELSLTIPMGYIEGTK